MKKLSGRQMLRGVGKFEDRCEKASEKHIAKMGKKAPRCYEYVGQLLAYIDLIGSCHYSCPGGAESAHIIWYLAARASSFGRAALRLMKMGFYDEALIIVRSIGEITNLFVLFSMSPQNIEEWEKSDRSYRLAHLTPGKIRKRIENLKNDTPYISASHYAALCEVSTHPVPDLRPQRFNHAGKSMTGGIYLQEVGILVVLNEMALALSLLAVSAAKVCKVPADPFKEIRNACVMCIRSIEGIHLEDLSDMWKEIEKVHANKK
jgi:hypothetical protein